MCFFARSEPIAGPMADTDFQTRLETEELLARSGGRPLYLTSVEVNGGDAFLPYFYRKLLLPLLADLDYTLNLLVRHVEDTTDKLEKTNVFRSVKASLHSDFKAALPLLVVSYNKEPLIATKVIFDLQLININVGEVFLNINSEDNLNLHLNYRNNNINDNAELVEIGVNYNPYRPFDHLLSLGTFMALLNNPAFKFLIDVCHAQQNNELWQQLKQNLALGVIGVQYQRGRALLVLTGLALAKRNLHSIDDKADDDLKFFAGEYLKTLAINRIQLADVEYHNPFSHVFPVRGFQAIVHSEVLQSLEQPAALSYATFAKLMVGLELYQSWRNNNITAKLSADIGGIYNLNPETPIHISDRFYLGGISSLRGFTKNGVNPHGGTQFYQFAATVFAKLPKFFIEPTPSIVGPCDVSYEPHPLRVYGSASVGNCGSDVWHDSLVPVSLGFGLKYFDYYANFDLGYFVARRYGSSDTSGVKNGLQFSMTIGGSNRM